MLNGYAIFKKYEEFKEISHRRRVESLKPNTRQISRMLSNYENRVHKFMNDMANQPIIIQNNPLPLITTTCQKNMQNTSKLFGDAVFRINNWKSERTRIAVFFNMKRLFL